MCGIQLSQTTAHHPAANGLAERLLRTLKAAIMCHADQHWAEALPLVLLGIRTAFNEDLQASVAELVYGEPLRIPSELLTPTTSYEQFSLTTSLDSVNDIPLSIKFAELSTKSPRVLRKKEFFTRYF
jgi:hypothetical protein